MAVRMAFHYEVREADGALVERVVCSLSGLARLEAACEQRGLKVVPVSSVDVDTALRTIRREHPLVRS